MEPLNKKERTTTFLQFLVLFLGTIVFVVMAVFFNKQFFGKDYAEYKKQAQALKELSAIRDQILIINRSLVNMDSMDEVDFKNELDKVSDVKKQIHELSINTNGLGGIVPAMDSIFIISLKKTNNLRGLTEAKSDISVLGKNIEELKTANEKLTSDKERLQEKIDACKKKCTDC